MAVVNSKTRGAIRLALARSLEGDRAFPTKGHTLTGGSTTTAIDTKYAAGIFSDDHFNNAEFVNQTTEQRTFITDWVKSTGTWTMPTVTTNASGNTYEIHHRDGWLSGQYDDAIDMAIQAAGHASALQDAVSHAYAFRAGQTLYPAPSGWKYVSRIDLDINRGRTIRHTPSAFDTRQAFKDAAARTYIAQSFTTPASNPSFILGDVYLLLGKVGSPTGNLTVTIETDSSSAPGSISGGVASSSTVDATTLTADHAYVRFAFTAKPVLTANTTYWLVLKSSASADSSNYVTWALDTDAGYMDGSALQGTAVPAWSVMTGDFVFIIRDSQPEWGLRLIPREDFEVIPDTTRLISLTTRGIAKARQYGDGIGMLVQGQTYPSLPTTDASVVEVPYDYVVARAALHLVSENPSKYRGDPRAATATWAKFTDDLERKMRTLPRSGAIDLEAL